MPVPVPRVPDNFAPHITKQNASLCSLQVPDQSALPPSFGTREQWINSLPSWRRTKPRRIWEEDPRFAEQGEQLQQQQQQLHFQQGLAYADNASAIKGSRAHACIPPMNALLQSVGLEPFDHSHPTQQDIDDDMSSEGSYRDYDDGQWSVSSPNDNMDVEFADGHDNDSLQDGLVYERGAFTPIFEDDSPELSNTRDASSSPIEPVTPFADYVDRAVATAQHCQQYGNAYSPGPVTQNKQCYPAYEAQVPEVAAPDLVVTPSATTAYKRLADPLSQWVASYVWKVCTTGMSLPSIFFQPHLAPPPVYGSSPPAYLAGSVHSLLLSTLLQPSAVFLAVWYIVRLPVYLGPVALAQDNVKEHAFRAALFGNPRTSAVDRETAEMNAPFRLIVLGCMFANKWLDDHTFSNKTWHTISSIPIESLNTLESLTLDIFSYDLNVPRNKWSQWLSHVMSYHMSLTSPAYPQPISRPSANPHSIVRKAIEEILQAPAVYNSDTTDPQPVFLGLDERRLEKRAKEQALAVDISDIDLDEDGPLREEYLPKRRISAANAIRESSARLETYAPPRTNVPPVGQEWARRPVATVSSKPLPPPAKWSPAGDEPILRERNRMSGHYVAVQAPPAPAVPFQVLPQPMYIPNQDMGYINQNWAVGAGYPAVNAQAVNSGFYEQTSLHPASQSSHSYPFVQPLPVSHSRTQSLSYEHEAAQARDRARSYSQSRFPEFRPSDLRMHAIQLAPIAVGDNAQWAQYGHQTNMLGASSYQSQWLRT